MKKIIKAVVAAATLAAAPAMAQDTTDTTYRFSSQSSAPFVRFPALFGVPSAVPALGGTARLYVDYGNPRGAMPFGAPGSGDFSAGATFTLGNPVKYLSVTGGIDITGAKPFADAGSFNLSASRFIFATPNQDFALFAGGTVSQLGAFGTAKGIPVKYSGYLTALADANFGGTTIPMIATVGYGTDVYVDAAGTQRDSYFWGVGAGVLPGVALSVSGNSGAINAGANFATSAVPGLGVSAGVYDILDNTNQRRLGVSIGYGRQLFGMN